MRIVERVLRGLDLDPIRAGEGRSEADRGLLLVQLPVGNARKQAGEFGAGIGDECAQFVVGSAGEADQGADRRLFESQDVAVVEVVLGLGIEDIGIGGRLEPFEDGARADRQPVVGIAIGLQQDRQRPRRGGGGFRGSVGVGGVVPRRFGRLLEIRQHASPHRAGRDAPVGSETATGGGAQRVLERASRTPARPTGAVDATRNMLLLRTGIADVRIDVVGKRRHRQPASLQAPNQVLGQQPRLPVGKPAPLLFGQDEVREPFGATARRPHLPLRDGWQRSRVGPGSLGHGDVAGGPQQEGAGTGFLIALVAAPVPGQNLVEGGGVVLGCIDRESRVAGEPAIGDDRRHVADLHDQIVPGHPMGVAAVGPVVAPFADESALTHRPEEQPGTVGEPVGIDAVPCAHRQGRHQRAVAVEVELAQDAPTVGVRLRRHFLGVGVRGRFVLDLPQGDLRHAVAVGVVGDDRVERLAV